MHVKWSLAWQGLTVKAVSMPSRRATSFVIGGLRGSTATSGSCCSRLYFVMQILIRLQAETRRKSNAGQHSGFNHFAPLSLSLSLSPPPSPLQVDTHVHASSSMGQKHLLRFMKKKARTAGQEVVCEMGGERKTLNQVRRRQSDMRLKFSCED